MVYSQVLLSRFIELGIRFWVSLFCSTAFEFVRENGIFIKLTISRIERIQIGRQINLSI